MVLSIIQMPLPPSASDWTRFKRLASVGSDYYVLIFNPNYDVLNIVSPAGCAPCSSRAGIRRDHDQIVGTGRTRREASKWIDFVAAQQTDITTVKQDGSGRQIIRQQLCDGQTCPPPSVLRTKVGVLRSAVYQHSRIV